MTPRRERSHRLLVILASSLLTLAAVEASLRIAGIRWRPDISQNEPTMHEPDPVLGWRNNAGRYVHAAYAAGLPDLRITFLNYGLRRTSAADRGQFPGVAILGGSFTQGWAVSDEETYAWRFQEAFPRHEVFNYGTGAYGTYQSLLSLERHYGNQRKSPNLVLYGFVEHHELRNVGDPRWLQFLTRFSRRAHLALPFCLDGPGDELDCRPPAAYPWAFLDRISSLVHFLRVRHAQRRSGVHVAQAEAVTRKLLMRLNTLSRAHGARFVTVLLDLSAEKGERYTRFFQAAGIDSLDCRVPDMNRPEFKVPGDGHPNALLHAIWADCLKKGLSPILHGGSRANVPRNERRLIRARSEEGR